LLHSPCFAHPDHSHCLAALPSRLALFSRAFTRPDHIAATPRIMLASPLVPTSHIFSSSHAADDYRPAKDLEAFNKLLPPPVEFIEGSSSGAYAVPEGKYKPINVPPPPPKTPAPKIEVSTCMARQRLDCNGDIYYRRALSPNPHILPPLPSPPPPSRLRNPCGRLASISHGHPSVTLALGCTISAIRVS
jgi:hypothetical protein